MSKLLTTRTRLLLKHEVDETLRAIVGKARRDRFGARALEIEIQARLMDAWDEQVDKALQRIIYRMSAPFAGAPSIDELLSEFDVLSGKSLTDKIGDAGSVIEETFRKSNKLVDSQFRSETGREPIKKDRLGFGILFGLTNQHAMQAMQDQLFMAAGGFWDAEMTEVMRKAFEEIFATDATTGDAWDPEKPDAAPKTPKQKIIERLQTTVNERLKSREQKTKPGAYFARLAEFTISRTRNVGTIYRAKAVGVTRYRIVNPRDSRTSPICMKLSAPGKSWALADAEGEVTKLLTATSLDDLKEKVPFFQTGDEDRPPVLPVHYGGCRSELRPIYDRLILED
jgi:hypothetical protein